MGLLLDHTEVVTHAANRTCTRGDTFAVATAALVLTYQNTQQSYNAMRGRASLDTIHFAYCLMSKDSAKLHSRFVRFGTITTLQMAIDQAQPGLPAQMIVLQPSSICYTVCCWCPCSLEAAMIGLVLPDPH